MLRRLCVYCGSSLGSRARYVQGAAAVGRLLAERGISLVYGAGNLGLMGAAADAALAAGGEVIGVIPRALVDRELAHHRLSELRVVDTMHQRKALMADLSDGFLALPGGIGTLEELSEILTWRQLDIHAKPIGLLDEDGYWRHLIGFLDHAVAEGFVRQAHRDALLVDSEAERLIDRLSAAAASGQA